MRRSQVRRDVLNLLGAVVLFIAAPILVVRIVLSDRWSLAMGWLIGIAVLVAGATILWRWTRPHDLAQARQLRMTEERAFVAKRCFQLEWVGDFGPHYVIELASGEALYLAGQHLCHLEPIVDDEDPSENQPRQFPSAEFVVVRHKKQGYIFDIECSGAVLEPEEVKQFFTSVEGLSVPEDGDILPVGAYESLKKQLPSGNPNEV